MFDYLIGTENTSDMPESYLRENGIDYTYLPYRIDDHLYTRENELSSEEFYRQMRSGKMPITSQVNPEEAKKFFLEKKKICKNILHLSLSSGISGTYNSARLAAQEVMEEDPSVNIIVIDTLCASMGVGLVIDKAVKMRKQGLSMEENSARIREMIPHCVHAFTVDDLNHLYRGGRVSRTAALIGTVAGIKPILNVNDEGKLIPVTKVRGRKKALLKLVDYMEEHIGPYRTPEDTFFISHGDCLEDAEFVRDEITKRFGMKACMINVLSATIAAHAGPGTVALFFMGDNR